MLPNPFLVGLARLGLIAIGVMGLVMLTAWWLRPRVPDIQPWQVMCGVVAVLTLIVGMFPPQGPSGSRPVGRQRR